MTKLDPDPIHAQLALMWQPCVAIQCFESLASTNSYALSQVCRLHHWHVLVAETQTAGRGRLGRTWHSPRGENIYLSLSWVLALSKEQQRGIASLSLVAGLSVVHVLQEIAPAICWQVKWPNDLWGNGHKVAGVLLESQSAGALLQLVLGLGLNVNGLDYSDIRRTPPASSLALLTGKAFDRNRLVAAVINRFLTDYGQFMSEGLGSFQARWEKVDALAGQKLVFTFNNQQETGIARGINATGQLLIERAEGSLVPYSVGEVQLQPQV